MDDENFYHFIHSLDHRHKVSFSKSVQNKNTSEYRLYERILKYKPWSEKTQVQVRGKSLTNSSLYYQTRMRLAQRILVSLVQQDRRQYSSFVLVEKAVEMRLNDLAKKLLKDLVEEYVQQDDVAALLYVHDFVFRIKSRYAVRFDLPEGLPSYEKLDTEMGERRVLIETFERLVRLYRSSEIEHPALLTNALTQLEGLTFDRPFKVYWRDKIRANLSLLQGDPIKAMLVFEEMVGYMMDSDRFSFFEKTKELSSLIRVCTQIGNYQNCAKYLLILNSLSPTALSEIIFWKKEKVKTSIYFSRHFALPDLATESQEQLFADRDFFEERIFINYLSYLVVAYFHSGEYTKAKQLLIEHPELVSKSAFVSKWEFQLLQAVIYLETGEHDLAERSLRSAYRICQRQEIQIGKSASAIFRHILNHGPKMDHDHLQSKVQELILLEAQTSKMEREIDFSIWFTSKLNQIPQKEIITSLQSMKFSTLYRIN